MLYSKCEGQKELVEKYVQEIEEQFGRESVSVVQKKANGSLTKPVIVKGKQVLLDQSSQQLFWHHSLVFSANQKKSKIHVTKSAQKEFKNNLITGLICTLVLFQAFLPDFRCIDQMETLIEITYCLSFIGNL